MPPLGLFPPLYTEVDKGHGRIEERSIRVADASCIPIDFPGAKQIFQIERTAWRGAKFTRECVYGITSHSQFSADAKQLLNFNRHHWSIENKSHLIRDVVFQEDSCRIRTGNAPKTFAVLRNTAISLVKLSEANISVASSLRACSRNHSLALRAIGISAP